MNIGLNIDGAKLNEQHRLTLVRILPNVEADIDENEAVLLYREVKPTKDLIEFTIYYQSKTLGKRRVDFNVDMGVVEDFHILPQDATITYWGDAARAIL